MSHRLKQFSKPLIFLVLILRSVTRRINSLQMICLLLLTAAAISTSHAGYAT